MQTQQQQRQPGAPACYSQLVGRRKPSRYADRSIACTQACQQQQVH